MTEVLSQDEILDLPIAVPDLHAHLFVRRVVAEAHLEQEHRRGVIRRLAADLLDVVVGRQWRLLGRISRRERLQASLRIALVDDPEGDHGRCDDDDNGTYADSGPFEDVEKHPGKKTAFAGSADIFGARADIFEIQVLLFVRHPLPPLAIISQEYIFAQHRRRDIPRVLGAGHASLLVLERANEPAVLHYALKKSLVVLADYQPLAGRHDQRRIGIALHILDLVRVDVVDLPVQSRHLNHSPPLRRLAPRPLPHRPLPLQLEQFLEHLVTGRDGTRVGLETTLRHDHVGKLFRQVHVRHLQRAGDYLALAGRT